MFLHSKRAACIDKYEGSLQRIFVQKWFPLYVYVVPIKLIISQNSLHWFIDELVIREKFSVAGEKNDDYGKLIRFFAN